MISVEILDTSTGEKKTVEMELDWNQWNWEEGNYACDCNRGHFMYGKWQNSCGDGRFKVRVKENGEYVYSEY